MHRLPLLLPWLLAPGFALAQAEPPIQQRASVALHVGPARVFVGQAVDVTLRIELEQRLLREQLIQLFQQRIDVPVRIETPWAQPLDGWHELGPRPDPPGGAPAVVDGSVASLRRTDDVARGEQRFAVYELVARLVPTRTGTLAIPRATLAFAWAAGFDEDFLGDRVPRDRRDERLTSSPLEVQVEELPAAGRPRAFTGLVGALTASATLAGPEARVGDGLTLALAVAGDGDLRPFVAPALAAVPGFHVRGVREASEPGRRTVVYDLVALRAGQHRIPAIAVPYFDPRAARYEVAATEPLAVTVAPAADGTRAIDATGRPLATGDTEPVAGPGEAPGPEPAAPVPGVEVLFDLLPVAATPNPVRADFADPEPLAGGWLATGLLAPWLAALGCWLLRRRAETREQRARHRRRRAAAGAFRRELATAGADRGAALARYLAAWLDCAPAAVISPMLPQRLGAAGLAVDLARAVDHSLDLLAAARFGVGVAPPGDTPADTALLELVGRVDRELRAQSRRRPTVTMSAAALALAIATASLLPAQQGDLPAEAARHFAAGDAARAAGLYRQALDAGGFEPAALGFDLGNCAHRLGRSAEAVLWFTRALRVAPCHLEARANLGLVQQQLGLTGAGPRPLANVWLEGVLAAIHEVPVGSLLALAAVLQAGGWALLLLRKRQRGQGGVLLAAGLLLAVVAARDHLVPPGAAAIVLRDGVRMFAEPHERVGVVATLRAGETIAVLEASPRWARIRRGGDAGWIEAKAFERVALR